MDLNAEAVKEYTSEFGPHHRELERLKNRGFEPKVIYDIGACVLHWTKWARRVYPDAEYYAFDAWDAVEPLYVERKAKYHIGVLGAENREVDFYQNDEAPWGNSIFKENSETFSEKHKVRRSMRTLDSVIREKGWPCPDLVKIDVQGCEMDIIRGALETFKETQYLIAEMQHTDYNAGAPKFDEVGPWLEGLGWECIAWRFASGSGMVVDADYLFRRKPLSS